MSKRSPRASSSLASLRARLIEAEETLSAIRTGEVDALVVIGPAGEQLYTLRGSDDGYRAMVEQMQEGALTVDKAGLILYCNRRFAEMLTLPHGDVVGSTLSRFVPGTTSVQALLDGAGEGTRWEIDLMRGSGDTVPAQISLCPLAREEGDPLFVLVVTDLTVVRQKEEILEAERLTRSILDNTVEAIVVCDRRGRVIRANHAARLLCPAGAPAGLRFLEAFPLRMDDPQRVLATATGGAGVQVVLATMDCAGVEDAIRLLVSAGPLYGPGDEIVGCVISLVDDSPRQRVEQELRLVNETLEQRVLERTVVVQQQGRQLRALACELARAEQRERARLGQVLHDHLQQLLVAASLKAGRLRRHAGQGAPLEAAHQLEDLLRQAIQASRDLTMELSPPILSEAGLGSALKWLGRQMQERHGLEVAIHVPDALPAPLEGLGLVLFNAAREMLFNVVKHAGVLRARVTLDADHDGVVRLSVEDQGRGFSSAWCGAADSGMGLFTIRDRMELLGGKLEVHSNPGEGARVTVSLPLTAAQAGKLDRFPLKAMPDLAPSPRLSAHDVAPSHIGRPLRILLADDHTILRQGLASLLANEPDMEAVAEASNGREAIELTRLLRPDVIVMDASMPEMSGLEATRHIVEHFPGTVVVGLSMYDSEDMSDAMRAAGARAYVSKEKASEELCSVIRSATAGRPGAHPPPAPGPRAVRRQPDPAH